MKAYAIESGIPLPYSARKHGQGARPKTALREAFDALQVGQSFFVETSKEASRARGLASHIHDRKFSFRKVPHKGWRIWRVE